MEKEAGFNMTNWKEHGLLVACKNVLREIPELWGDQCINGIVEVKLTAETILSLEDAVRRFNNVCA